LETPTFTSSTGLPSIKPSILPHPDWSFPRVSSPITTEGNIQNNLLMEIGPCTGQIEGIKKLFAFPWEKGDWYLVNVREKNGMRGIDWNQ